MEYGNNHMIATVRGILKNDPRTNGKREDNALEKFEKCLTEHQKDILVDRILRAAVRKGNMDFESPHDDGSGTRYQALPSRKLFEPKDISSAVSAFYRTGSGFWVTEIIDGNEFTRNSNSGD